MKRQFSTALGVLAVALAVPAAALATHHRGAAHAASRGHDRFHHGATGGSGAPGANTVTSYSDGTLVLALANGGSLTGSVTDQTRFICVGDFSDPGRGWGGRGHGGRYNFGREGGPTGATGTTGSTGGWGPHGPGGGGSTGASGPQGPGDGSDPTGGSGSSPTTGPGWGGRGRGGRTGSTGGAGSYTLPPPCDSSLLLAGAGVGSAQVAITTRGVLFAQIVLLPAVQ